MTYRLILCVVVSTFFATGLLRAEEKSVSDKLNATFDAEWEWSLKEFPSYASYLGDKRYNARWPDLSLANFEKRQQHRIGVLKQLDKIDVAALVKSDRLNYRLFRKKYETDVDEYKYGWHFLPLNQRGGLQDANSITDAMRFETIQDFEDWIARLRAFPVYVDQTTALMRQGIETKRVHARIVMKRVPNQIDRQIVDDPTRSLFFKPFRNIPNSIAEAERKRLVAEAKAAIQKSVIPSFRRFKKFFNDEYLPSCFERVGVSQFPDGQEFYAFRARKYTTTKLTPKQIHEIGQREVRRIRGEMKRIISQLKYKGTFKEFLEFLRNDPQFYYKTPKELLEAYRAISKTVDPKLVKLFRRLPRIPYGVEPIPMHMAPDTTTAYYRPPSADGLRAGTYFVNLYRPEVRPKYEIEVLSLHEAVPGHHLQIALAMELENVPAFRRYEGYTAFIEGWGLYSESLGGELGLYQDPYSKFGQLTYEMWRAVRLVVDTGMHSMNWSRQRAVDFFANNTAKTLLDIENEIDRYIAWPGQALAYKIGELKIKELRRRATIQLGDQFDVREFHEVVLSHGAVPLDVLETNVDAWIAARKQ